LSPYMALGSSPIRLSDLFFLPPRARGLGPRATVCTLRVAHTHPRVCSYLTYVRFRRAMCCSARGLALLVLGAVLGVGVTIGVAYPTLRDKWIHDTQGVGSMTQTARGVDLSCAYAQPQSPKDVSAAYSAGTATAATPTPPAERVGALALANVHFHAHAEHKSDGEYDALVMEDAGVYGGYDCANLSTALSASEMKPYEDWKYCNDTEVGGTYEVHWVYSSGADPNGNITDGLSGAFTYQNNPFIIVRAQVFVITNDPDDDLPGDDDLFDGWRADDITDAVAYIGSTTGDAYDNARKCSPYQVTWHVDRTCQRISAKSFDDMCKTMKIEHGASDDLKPHRSRPLASDRLSSSTQTTMTAPYDE